MAPNESELLSKPDRPGKRVFEREAQNPTEAEAVRGAGVAGGIVPRSVELYEASAAVNDVKRPSRFEQQRGCLFPFRSEQQARLVGPEVA